MPSSSISKKLHDDLDRIIQITPPGERLPSEPFLAKQLGVSRATLREAMRTFESQGLLRRRQGSGTYVTHPSVIIDSGLEILESIERIADRLGLSVTMGELKAEERHSREEECTALSINQDCQVLEVSRIIQTKERPVAFLVDLLPKDYLTIEDLKSNFTGSVLDVLLRRGSPKLVLSRTDITAVTASAELARSLGIQRGDVLLLFTALLFAEDGKVVDYSKSYFLPGFFRFHVVRRVG